MTARRFAYAKLRTLKSKPSLTKRHSTVGIYKPIDVSACSSRADTIPLKDVVSLGRQAVSNVSLWRPYSKSQGTETLSFSPMAHLW